MNINRNTVSISHLFPKLMFGSKIDQKKTCENNHGAEFAKNFTEGDVIYGLELSRNEYVSLIDRSLRVKCFTEGNYYTIDTYNNVTWNCESVNIPNYAHGAICRRINNFHYNDVARNNAMHYYISLVSSDRNPLNYAEREVKFSNISVSAQAMFERQVRSACKFGIDYIIMNKGKTVHFILDDIPVSSLESGKGSEKAKAIKRIRENNKMLNQYMVVKSEKIPRDFRDNHLGRYVPITTSELKHCFRNRDKLLETGRLKFYFRGREVPPPWETYPGVWKKYKHHCQTKSEGVFRIA